MVTAISLKQRDKEFLTFFEVLCGGTLGNVKVSLCLLRFSVPQAMSGRFVLCVLGGIRIGSLRDALQL